MNLGVHLFTCSFFQMDPAFEPHNMETRTLFGLKLEQQRNNSRIDESVFKNIVTKRQDVSEMNCSLHHHYYFCTPLAFLC